MHDTHMKVFSQLLKDHYFPQHSIQLMVQCTEMTASEEDEQQQQQPRMK